MVYCGTILTCRRLLVKQQHIKAKQAYMKHMP
jgi:hypothetical protein